MADRCRTVYDPTTGEVLGTVLGPRPMTDEEAAHFAVIVGMVRQQMNPEAGARQADAIQRLRQRVADRAARRLRLSVMRMAYRAKRGGWRRA